MKIILTILMTIILSRIIIIVTRMSRATKYKINHRLYLRKLRVIFEPTSFGSTSATKVLHLMESGLLYVTFFGVFAIIIGLRYSVKLTLISGVSALLYLIFFHWSEIKRLFTLRIKRFRVRYLNEISFSALAELKLATFQVGFPGCRDYILKGDNNDIITRYRIVDKDDHFLVMCNVTKEYIQIGATTPVERYRFHFALNDIPNWKNFAKTGLRFSA